MNVDLASCIAGRKDAWDHFVRASAPVIYAAVRRALRNRGVSSVETADRVQDVYLRLLRDECKLLRTFDAKRASLATWLTLIARTVVHEHARRRTLPTFAIDDRDSAIGSTDVADASLNNHAADTVAKLPLTLLSDQQRQVIDMLFQQGLSVEQAATRLGVEAQTIRSAKHKALARLREHLAGRASGGPAEGKSREIPGPPNDPNKRGYPAARPAITEGDR